MEQQFSDEAYLKCSKRIIDERDIQLTINSEDINKMIAKIQKTCPPGDKRAILINSPL